MYIYTYIYIYTHTFVMDKEDIICNTCVYICRGNEYEYVWTYRCVYLCVYACVYMSVYWRGAETLLCCQRSV